MKINNFYQFRLLVIIVIVFSIGSLIFLKLFNKTWNPIESDGAGYYLYLPQILSNNDISGTRLTDYVSNDDFVDTNIRLLEIENGNRLNKYPIGVALMILPFYIVAETANIVFFNHSVNQFESIYEIAIIFSSCFYLIVSLFFLWKILNKRFNNKITFYSIILLLLGTNILHYTFFDTAFSHIYAFAQFSIFLYLVDVFQSQKAKTLYWINLGVILGLIIITRQSNIIIITLLIFQLLSELKQNGTVDFIKMYLRKLFILLLFTLLIFSIQMCYWLAVTGHPLIYSYINELFNFLQPQIFNVLFSVHKGVFFWSPVLFFSVAGIILIWKKNESDRDRLIKPIIIILLLQTYIISSWWAWSYGDSFGHRGFTEFLSLLLLPFAYFISWLFTKKNRLIAILLILLIFLNLFQMHQYWRGLINPNGMTWNEYLKIFLRPCTSLFDFLRCE